MEDQEKKYGFFQATFYAKMFILFGAVGVLIGALLGDFFFILAGFVTTFSGYYIYNRVMAMKKRIIAGDTDFEAKLRQGVEAFNQQYYPLAASELEELMAHDQLTKDVERSIVSLLARSYHALGDWDKADYYSDKLFSGKYKSFFVKPPLESHIARIESAFNLGKMEKAILALNEAKKRFKSKPVIIALQKKLESGAI
ncbi:MAG: hypothetical protein ACTSP4_05910 [Candidatus Hodarchaeales archaeon]